MESYDETENSLPYIDDTDEEINYNRYNLKIIENYQNKNRNIEISNQYRDEVAENSLSPVAPLAEETELSDSRNSDSQEEGKCKHMKRISANQTGMKLVIRGCNSTISIQGLDNKSSITFKRKSGRVHQRVVSDEPKAKPDFIKTEASKPVEKTKKGRWKMLTKSLISKSARFERTGLDERYPKYVLLKNEEEMSHDRESYPKMVAFNKKQKSVKEKENLETKSEFNFKKSFKNKTNPLLPMDEILAVKNQQEKEKSRTAGRSLSESRNILINRQIAVERRKSFAVEKMAPVKSKDQEMTFNSEGPSHVFSEIQGILEDTLKLYPEGRPAQEQPPECSEGYPSVPPQFCQFSCRDPCCCPSPRHQPPMYIPVYPPYNKPRHLYKHSNTQTNENEFESVEGFEKSLKPEGEFQDLPFGILSSFFPRVVIMKTFQNTLPEDGLNDVGAEDTARNFHPSNINDTKACEKQVENNLKPPSILEVPQKNLTLKSSMISTEVKPESELDVPSFYSEDFYVNCLTVNEVSSSEDDHKTKTDDSEATEYLHFCESEAPENESVKPIPTPTAQKDPAANEEEQSTNLSLTKIGYKMYDNLTKLSLNREKEIIEKPETTGCGCTGNGTKNPPYNITLESNNRMVKVTVPENELNFQIVNSTGGDISIGVSSAGGGRNSEDKKVVRKNELWHPDYGRKELVISRSEKPPLENPSQGSQKIKLSMADKKEVVLSIEMDQNKQEKPLKKLTKEIKIGTDDFDLAGGDFPRAFAGYKNLSPRTGQLLKNLQEKLELGEKERKFLTEKINEKFTDQKFQTGILPGIFLVQQISPRMTAPKKPIKAPVKQSKKVPESNDTVAQLREYYCEECLATMRIFEDELPSVKNMVDKFETIIQLEGC